MKTIALSILLCLAACGGSDEDEDPLRIKIVPGPGLDCVVQDGPNGPGSVLACKLPPAPPASASA